MSGYIEPPLVTDPDELAKGAIVGLMEAIPGWKPNDASLTVWHIQVLARLVAVARDVASDVPRSIFRFYGKELIGLQPVDSAAATVATTWLMTDAQGYTVEAGTIAAFRTAGDELIPFEVVETFRVSPGEATTRPGQVLMRALDVGSDGNGLQINLEVVDALTFVREVVATAPTAGGVDAETDDEYLDRLHEELQLLTPRPILAQDFAVLARRTPGVYRALAIGEYNPEDNTYNNERMVAVAVVGRDGEALGPVTREAVRVYLDAMREVNFVVKVADPTYTTVSVSAAVRTLPGYDQESILASVRTEIARALDPGVWGGGDLTPPEWRASANRVRYTEIAALIDRVPGVDYVDTASLLVNGAPGDVILTGAAPLPVVGTITVTVAA